MQPSHPILDRFHIVAKMKTALDQVRAGEARRLARDGYEPVLKKTRWCVLKRRANLTRQQRFRLRDLLRYNLQTVRAYLLKEDFQQFWEYQSPSWAGKFLDEWCCQVMRSRIEPKKKIARTLRSHRALILNYFRARKQFSSGVVEGLNNKAKLTMRKSYGFRTFHVTEIALYHALGKLPEPTSPTDFSDEAKKRMLHHGPPPVSVAGQSSVGPHGAARQSRWMSYCLIQECSRAGRALPHQNAPGATSACQSITRVPRLSRRDPNRLSCSIGEPAFPSRPGAARAAARNGGDWEERSHPEPRAARSFARAWRGWRAPDLPRSEHRGTLPPVEDQAPTHPLRSVTSRNRRHTHWHRAVLARMVQGSPTPTGFRPADRRGASGLQHRRFPRKPNTR